MTAPVDPAVLAGRLVLVGCSRRKQDTTVPLPALELYQGGAVPAVRGRLGGVPAARARIRVLSAEHGIVGADEPLLPYNRRLDPDRAAALRQVVARQLAAEIGAVRELLVVAEPPYLDLIGPLLDAQPTPALQWVGDPYNWAAVAAVLDLWRWP